jgi:CBS domain containing-hemolysin-like protein
MSIAAFIIWWGVMLVGFALSAMYSGLETGSYRLNRVRLHVLEHQGLPAARALARLTTTPTVLLGTLLIGNNIANYMGTAGLTVLLEAAGFSETETILLNVLVATSVLFVFGEVLPKDLFAAHADAWMYRLTPAITWSRRLFLLIGVLPLVNAFSWTLGRLLQSGESAVGTHPRRQVGALVREGLGAGLISDEQSAIIERVLALVERTVDDEMTPWPRVARLRERDPAEAIWQILERSPHSRFPVTDQRGRVVGVVSAKRALFHGRDACPPVRELMSPPQLVSRRTALRDALAELQRARRELAIVVDRQQRPLGLVTIKDLVEPITGELSHW